jgi:hypothetical protein
MPIPVQCTGCKVQLNAPDTAVGKKVKCPKCQTVVAVPGAAPAPKPAPPPPSPPPLPAPAPFTLEDEPAPPPARKSGTAPKPAAKPAAPPPEPLGLDDDEPVEEKPAKKSGTAPKPAPRKRHDDADDEGGGKKPVRKKRGAAKAGGGPPVALVLSIAGLIGLAIVGFVAYAAYSASSKEDAKGGGGKAAVPSGWKQVTANKGGFKAYFPADGKEDDAGPPELPPADKKKKKAEPPPYTAGVVMVALPDESKAATAMGFKFRPNVSEAEREKVVREFTDTFTKDPVGIGLKVLGQRDVTWLGQKAKETLVEGPATAGTIQFVIRQVTVGSNVYVAMIGAKGGRPTPEDENGFFDNFEVLK